jgi:flagellar M-ring protein FliF
VEQVLSVWNALDLRRRAVVAGATLAVFLAVLGLARMASAPTMALLYAGLESGAAGEIVQTLDQRNIRFEVRGDAIYVDARLRDETRMSLAAQGLPANSTSGYELLDGLSGFGTTSQMFDAAYWRAKEGELARTIVASPHARAARVHISQGSGVAFRRDQRGSASVMVMPAGGALSPQQAQAIRFLVASAVAGMTPAEVSIIDTSSGLVVADAGEGAANGSDRAAELRRNVERLVDAHVGAGRAVVEVSVETVTDRETIVERRIEPESRVAMSQDTEERNATSSEARPGAVTVTSNLPDGDAAAGDGRSESRDVTSRQRVNYDMSATQREIQRGPGAVRRLTVAVLIDGVRVADEAGRMQWAPRPEGEIEALRELVASAVGYDAARGDVITIRSLPFEPVARIEGSAPATGLIERLGLDVMGLIRLAALAVVALFLALFVLRPLLLGRRDGSGPLELPRPVRAVAQAAGPYLSGEIAEDGDLSSLRSVGADGDRRGAGAEDPVERMRRLIVERQDETVEILRSWMEEREETR